MIKIKSLPKQEYFRRYYQEHKQKILSRSKKELSQINEKSSKELTSEDKNAKELTRERVKFNKGKITLYFD